MRFSASFGACKTLASNANGYPGEGSRRMETNRLSVRKRPSRSPGATGEGVNYIDAQEISISSGSSVTLTRNGKTQTLRIVGEDEADPSRGTISHVSPLARQLFGKGVGEVVRVGAGEAEILAIG